MIRENAPPPDGQQGTGEGCDGVALIAAERKRQVESEGWTPEHDDEHTNGEMAMAAIAYTLFSYVWGREYRRYWPWEQSWWKPDSKRTVRNLVKAGQLIVAEINRLQREERRHAK